MSALQELNSTDHQYILCGCTSRICRQAAATAGMTTHRVGNSRSARVSQVYYLPDVVITSDACTRPGNVVCTEIRIRRF